jgi:hypothetical protein
VEGIFDYYEPEFPYIAGVKFQDTSKYEAHTKSI